MASDRAAKNGAEKRRFRRLTVRLDVSWLSEATDDINTAVATTLGAGGLFVPSEHPLPARTPIRVRFQLPGSGSTHDLRAQVVWANDADTPGVPASGRGMGIAFRNKPAQMELAKALERIPEEVLAAHAPDGRGGPPEPGQ
jgi:Tfp pilus assembly protein PilZ